MQKYFGEFGGAYVPEMVRPALEAVEHIFLEQKNSPEFQKELSFLRTEFCGRPTPLIYANNLTTELKGAKIFLKNEGASLTGAHKINHCIGQILLAVKMGKKKIIAETGAGQHGLATATVCAKFGMQCEIYMGAVDYARQRPNVMWMETLGAKVIPVFEGSQTLKDAVVASMKAWINDMDTSYYLLGSALGPHPYPSIVRYFQSVIGQEIQEQLQTVYNISQPNTVIACVGGGSNAIGAFSAFLDDTSVELIGVEAGGDHTGHAKRFPAGKVGIVEGYKSYFLQNEDGQISLTHSISAGLDYAGIGPEHAHLHDTSRVTYTSATDAEVIDAVKILARTEGIIPALESAHAVAYALKYAPTKPSDHSIVINISGRADKDLFILGPHLAGEAWFKFLQSQIPTS